MSFNNPRECKNCGHAVLYWDDTNRGGRPYDVLTPGQYHQCSGWKPGFKMEKKTPYTPQLKPCKFGCGTNIIYNTNKGFFEEGHIDSDIEHLCPNHPEGYEYDEHGNKHDRKDKTREFIKQPPPPPTPPQTPRQQEQPKPGLNMTDLTEIKNALREIITVLQGQAALIQKSLDNEDVTNRYLRVISGSLNEMVEEYKQIASSNPRVSFEDGKALYDRTQEALYEEEDIEDELADQDDTTGIGDDINTFKPSDSGSKNVRNDL